MFFIAFVRYWIFFVQARKNVYFPKCQHVVFCNILEFCIDIFDNFGMLSMQFEVEFKIFFLGVWHCNMHLNDGFTSEGAKNN